MGRGSDNYRPFLDRTLHLDDETGARLRSLADESTASPEPTPVHEPRFAAAIIFAAMCTHNRRHEPGRSQAFAALDRLMARRNAAADTLQPTPRPPEQDGESTCDLVTRAEALLEGGRRPDASLARRWVIEAWEEFAHAVEVAGVEAERAVEGNTAEGNTAEGNPAEGNPAEGNPAGGDTAAFELTTADEILDQLASRILSRSRRSRARGLPATRSLS